MRPHGKLPIHPLALFALFATLSCGGGGGGDGGSILQPITAASVELSASTVSVAPQGTFQLTATARSSSGGMVGGRTFSWTSAAPSIATVSSAGLVTGLADGSTSVTVTVDGHSASAAVTVRTPVASVAVTPSTASAVVGGAAVQLTATARDAAGATLTGRTITWTTSSATIATVSQTGAVTAVAPGSATITAESEGRTATAAIVVTAPDPCSTVRAIGVGQTASATLSASDCRLSDNSVVQGYSISLAAETVLEIEMTSAAVDPYLIVLDASGNVFDEDDDGGTGTSARVLRDFPAGKYFIYANTFDANSYGAYQLAVRNAPTACVQGRAVSLPIGVSASLSSTTSCRLNNHSYLDRYELSVASRATVRMDLTSSVLDPFLAVADSKGTLVAQDDDSGVGLNAHIDVTLDPGQYVVMANAQPNQTGAYRLDVAVAVDPCAVSRTITSGQTLNSTLSSADCAVGTAGPIPYTQRYLLTVATAAPLQIDMTSSAVDAYLILQNASTGAVLAQNDDVAAGSRNARILGNFAAGQYIINATTYDFNETGAFALSVTPISTTTPVAITVTPSTLTLAAGLVQQLGATVTGNSNTTVTWSSSADAIATVSSVGLVRAIAPGSASITVRPNADPSKSFVVPVTVTQSQTGTPNLDIGAMYLLQSVQQLDNSVRLVANRDAVARVFVRGSRTGIGATTVRLRVYQGATLLQTYSGSVTPNTTVDEGCCSADFLIPAAYIHTGISVLADVDPGNAVAESNETDNQFPLSGTPQDLAVTTVSDLNIRVVPVRQSRSGATGVASATILNTLRSVWPLATVNATARATLVVDYTLVASAYDEWSYLVRDVELARRTDGSTSYYYGLARITYTSGVVGLAGGIPALSAVGIDEGSSFGAAEARLTLAHEIGHAFGLRHAPCGGAAGPDPSFPFSDGRTGAYGMDIASGNVVKLPTGTDIMGYCNNQWVSVYNYRNVFDLRTKNPNGVPAAIISSAPSQVLLVTGSVSASSARIDGSFVMNAAPSKDDPAGRFVVEGTDANGRVLFTQRFTPFEVADGRSGDEGFVVAVPASAALSAKLASVSVREASGARRDTRIKAPASLTAAGGGFIVSSSRSASGKVRLQWSPVAAPMILVRNANGEVVGISRSGDFDLSQVDGTGDVELLVSDGVTSMRRFVNLSTGAIRQ